MKCAGAMRVSVRLRSLGSREMANKYILFISATVLIIGLALLVTSRATVPEKPDSEQGYTLIKKIEHSFRLRENEYQLINATLRANISALISVSVNADPNGTDTPERTRECIYLYAMD